MLIEKENVKKNDAIKILFDASIQEYKIELDRGKALDAKCGIAITLVSGYFVAILMSLDTFVSRIVEFNRLTFCDILLPFSYISSLTLCMISLILMFDVLKLRDYRTLFPDVFYIEENFSSKEKMELQLMSAYMDARIFNKVRNDDRADSFEKSITVFLISLFTYLIYSIVIVL